MNWQVPRIDQSSYCGSGDPFLQTPVSHFRASLDAHQQHMDQHHFLSSSTTREQEELQRRKAEHMESLEIAPQHRYPAFVGRPGRLHRIFKDVSDIVS